jgi:hypothetical protein
LLGFRFAATQPTALLSLGSQTTSVKSYVHTDDFVGTLIGNNAATYGIRPEENTRIQEWINMFNDSPTVHSCYGALASDACKYEYGDSVSKTYKPVTAE